MRSDLRSRPLYGQVVAALVLKDLRAELRTRTTLTTLFMFGVLLITIFGFALNPVERNLTAYAAGLYWLGLSFSVLIALGRAFAREREAKTLEAMAMLPADRSAVFVAKFVVTFAWMLLLSVVLTPLFFAFMQLAVGPPWLEWALILLAGLFGFIAVGTLLSALSVQARGADLLLSLLFFPLTVPVLLPAVRLTDLLMQGQTLAADGGWLRLLVGYDIVFFVIALLLFDFAVEV